jgi:hypothetical protein
MNSIAHECRHAYQHDCVDGRGIHDDPHTDDYRNSFTKKDEEPYIYNDNEANYALYTEQDARDYADKYSEALGHNYRSNNPENSDESD